MKTLPFCDLWDLKVKMQSLEKGILNVMDEIFSIKDIVSQPCEWLSATIKFARFTGEEKGGFWWLVFPRKHNSKMLKKLRNGLKKFQDRPLKWALLNFLLYSRTSTCTVQTGIEFVLISVFYRTLPSYW